MSIKQRTKSLKSRVNKLSDGFYQLKVLNELERVDKGEIDRFDRALLRAGFDAIRPAKIEVLQINIGKLCNQTCAHCHVDAGPDRKEEQMSKTDLETCLKILDRHNIPKVDITGGAPEMNVHFRWFVQECRSLGVEVMHRCNLTIIQANKKYKDLPDFFAQHQVHVISSLPYFSKNRTDRQRGDGVFEDSIKSLIQLNERGYGIEGTGLQLDLVYNPTGAFLPGDQCQLEAEFKRQLFRRYRISFNKLYAITNLPISRFLEYLIESGNYEIYMAELVQAFNPATIDGLMCRTTISVSWDGFLYDCDFNQMLDLKVQTNQNHINNFDSYSLSQRTIAIGQHCFGCTAGSGSSCGGEIQAK